MFKRGWRPSFKIIHPLSPIHRGSEGDKVEKKEEGNLRR
jgi:hypothetical protein